MAPRLVGGQLPSILTRTMSDVAAQHRVPLLITGSVLFVVLLAFVQVPLCGYGPNLAKKLWTVIVRWWKKGDVRPWTWTCVEGGVIYVSSLPRHIDEITALQVSFASRQHGPLRDASPPLHPHRRRPTTLGLLFRWLTSGRSRYQGSSCVWCVSLP